jgi:hypothetical protein
VRTDKEAPPQWVEAQDCLDGYLNMKDSDQEGNDDPNDGSWIRVTRIDYGGVAETWCLKVAEDESFTAEGCVVKNCPMQWDIADRCIEQFSNLGETVLDPFAGIGSVPLRAIKLGRKGYGVELNTRYWFDSVAYCQATEREMAMPGLFDMLEDMPAEQCELVNEDDLLLADD